MRRRTKLLAIVAMSLLACDMQPNPQRQAAVVVYATYADEAYWSGFFRGFTEETGIPISIRHGDVTALVDDVIANRGSPPADVVITRSIANLWRAADKGALRPIQGGNANLVPEFLKDPDGLWIALNFQVTVIAYGVGARTKLPTNYSDLAGPTYRSRLCMSSSSLPVNRALIAMLIADLGLRPTELLVRGWMHNLALSPFDTDSELLAAIDSGSCEFGIVSGWTSGFELSSQADTETVVVEVQPGYVEIEGIGIARHARYPSSAQKLVDWMLSEAVQIAHARAVYAYPVHKKLSWYGNMAEISKNNIGLAGWHDEDAQLLAERAGYE